MIAHPDYCSLLIFEYFVAKKDPSPLFTLHSLCADTMSELYGSATRTPPECGYLIKFKLI